MDIAQLPHLPEKTSESSETSDSESDSKDTSGITGITSPCSIAKAGRWKQRGVGSSQRAMVRCPAAGQITEQDVSRVSCS